MGFAAQDERPHELSLMTGGVGAVATPTQVPFAYRAAKRERTGQKPFQETLVCQPIPFPVGATEDASRGEAGRQYREADS